MINGAVVDSTNPALPQTLSQTTIGMAGLAEALSLMHVGDRWQIALPANLALGAKGAANGAMPPNQTLLFDLTLISAVTRPRRGSRRPTIPFRSGAMAAKTARPSPSVLEGHSAGFSR